ncbi:MAG: hypothetical protein Q8S73_05380 [Deltaproteobacteria bacterium]|nr:hypothetical protein [Thiobacillus sp.]MDP3213513.1 hypothetical protein [Deltaproteobacteria bacterium]
MLVKFNKRTIVGGSIYEKDSEEDIANDLADQVVRQGNGSVVGLGSMSQELHAATYANNNTVLVGADGDFALTVTPSAATGAAMQAAIDGVYALGGGTVQLLPVTYTLTAEIALKSGVSLIGVAPTMTITTHTPEGSFILSGGTILQGNGTHKGLTHNAVDLGSASATFSSDTLQAVTVKGIGLTNFTRGIQIGAINSAGCIDSTFEDIYYTNCSEWGVDFENFQYSNFFGISGKNSGNTTNGGQRYASSVASATLLPGDSVFHKLWHVMNYRANQGIVFDSSSVASSGLNDLSVTKSQINRNGEGIFTAPVSVAATTSITFTGASAAANCAKFMVGMPVWFTDAAAADVDSAVNAWLGKGVSFFVLSNDGNVTITMGSTRDGAAVTWGTGSPYLTTGGFPLWEFRSRLGCDHTNYVFSGIAGESVGAHPIVCQNLKGSAIQVNDLADLNTSFTHTHLMMRGSCVNTRFNIDSIKPTVGVGIDLDSGSSGTQVNGLVSKVYGYSYGMGTRNGFRLGRGGVGVTAENTSGATVAGGTLAFRDSLCGIVKLAPVSGNIAAGTKVATITGLPTKAVGSSADGYHYPAVTPTRVSGDASNNDTVYPSYTMEPISSTSFAVYTNDILTSGKTYYFSYAL